MCDDVTKAQMMHKFWREMLIWVQTYFYDSFGCDVRAANLTFVELFE